VGKNNLLLALKELQAEGLTFDLTYSRGPFFLMGSQKHIDADRAKLGLPRDAPQGVVMQARGWTSGNMDRLMAEAGLSPRNAAVADARIMRDTMPAHRLAQYAAKMESNEKGEKMWFALSRRWFMGKDTAINPIKLDSRELLIECAEHAGLNMENVERVLNGEITSEQEIAEQVQRVHAQGIHSIPLIVFEVKGLAKGSWRENPALAETDYRLMHHGSGSKASFKTVLQRLHSTCHAAQAC